MSIITRSNIQNLLRPDLVEVFFDWNIYPALWKQIYEVRRATMAVEYAMEMQGLPMARIKQDGGPIASGTMRQGNMSSYVMNYYGISFQITRAAIMDNLYQAQFPQQARQLKKSLETLKNVNGAYIFNNAFAAGSTGSDGQPLCSTVHPIATGTLANTFPNAVGFNEAAVEDMITLIKGCKDLAGIPLNLSSVKALVPQNLAFRASRIFNSQYDPDTGNNAINPLVFDKYMPGGFIVNNFLTNPNNWFILTDEEHGAKYYLKESLDIDFVTDITTDNVTVRALERYAMGYDTWRFCYGAQG